MYLGREEEPTLIADRESTRNMRRCILLLLLSELRLGCELDESM